MKWGIVGSEAAKFTPNTEGLARAEIRALLRPGDFVYSGDCHLGGIDKWAVEEAQALGIGYREHTPIVRAWSAPGGYRDRNVKIAEDCDICVCITVKELPATYASKWRFPVCYHCKTKDHVKSGGCWTVKHARFLGKPGRIIVISEQDVITHMEDVAPPDLEEYPEFRGHERWCKECGAPIITIPGFAPSCMRNCPVQENKT